MPKVRRIRLHHVAVPLKKPIKHASHERSSSDNLVVRVELEDGSVGHGEGVPRPYVTGETIESTFATLRNADLHALLSSVDSADALIATLSAWHLPEEKADPRGMAGNAARSALEIALFDAYARSEGKTVGQLIRAVPEAAEILTTRPIPVRYSGAITAETDRKERISAWKMRLYGFRQVKIKVGVEGQDDPARLKKLRKILGPFMDIRIDANEAWAPNDLVDKVRALLPFGPTALEQPVPHAEVDSLTYLRPRLGLKVMLDESLCGVPDAENAINRQTADILNVRISKCGGFIKSLRIMALAKRAGLGVQLGCHPGETGILSAAGRHLASNVAGIRYIEGSYDRHVLKTNLSKPDITFRYGGKAPVLTGPGLGIEVDEQALLGMGVVVEGIKS